MRPHYRLCFRRSATAVTLALAATLIPAGQPAFASSPDPVPGDPLTGSGNVSRTLLTYTDLTTSESPAAPVDDGAFALPADAAPPSNTFEGTLTLQNTATSGGFSTIKDTYNYAATATVKHLPPVSVSLVQNGSYLIPAVRGLQYTGSPYWNITVSPGRAWDETGDAGMTRASMPFTLVERNANCTHNGVLTFLYDASSVSYVRYQITKETCEYFQFDMWGQVSASYQPTSLANDTTIENEFAIDVANQLPTKPIADLATDYPDANIDLTAFGSGVTPSAMTAYGFFYGGVNYVAGCQTRYGQYPYCGEMITPSYSTAKSMFAGVVLMRLAQVYGTSVANALIHTYVSETSSSAWGNVTFENTADMATGNYSSAGFETDEDGSTMSTFFDDETYTSKMSTALSFPRQSAPGTTWVYHSSDTFILARAENNFLQTKAGSSADIYNFLRDQILVPLHLSPDVRVTERTDNSAAGVPFGGYGLFWTQDDIAKMAKFLNNDDGAIDGTQILSSALLASAMQHDPNDRGLDTSGTPVFKYHYGLWARQFTSADNAAFATPFYVPFMSGFGGITVAMMPNGATYYYFSDNDEFSWSAAVVEANKLAPMTGGGGGGSGCAAEQLIGNGGFETGTAAPWSATPAVIDDRTIEAPHSGSWKAWLDGFGYTHTDTLSQQVTIPATCANASLEFYLHIDTYETQPVAYDNLVLEAVDAAGTSTQVASWSNLDAATGYAPCSFDLTPYIGQTITLEFTGTEDYSLQTSFVIDDVTLDVS